MKFAYKSLLSLSLLTAGLGWQLPAPAASVDVRTTSRTQKPPTIRDRLRDERRIRDSAARNALIHPTLRSVRRAQESSINSVSRAQVPFVTIGVTETEEPLEFSYVLTEASPLLAKKQDATESKSPITRAQTTIIPGSTTTGHQGGITQVMLKQGSTLVLNSGTVRMQGQKCSVTVAAKATAYAIDLGNDLAVFNLDSHHASDVSITLGGSTIEVPPGRVYIVTSNTARTYGELPIAKFVDFINPTSQGTYGNIHVFAGSFDYVSALDACPQVGYLLKQGNKSVKKLVKLTAISM